MGKISQGILDGVSGKVGNVVGASWKNIDYIRIKPTHVKNPRTEAQMNQRKRFKGVVNMANMLLYNIVRPIWDKKAVKMSGNNLFVQKNIGVFDVEGNITDYSKLVLSVGNLPISHNIKVVADDTVDSGIKISWDNTLLEGREDDKLMLIAINDSDGSIVPIFDIDKTRGEKSASVVLPFESRSDVHVYVFFSDSKKRTFSRSFYSVVTL